MFIGPLLQVDNFSLNTWSEVHNIIISYENKEGERINEAMKQIEG